MEIFNEYINMWKNYVNFHDRTTRRGFWMAILWNLVASFVLGIIGEVIGSRILSSLYGLAVFIPMLAMTVRRLHDAGKHWAWIFLEIVPTIMLVVATLMLVLGAAGESSALVLLAGVFVLAAIAAYIYLIVLLCTASVEPDGFPTV